MIYRETEDLMVKTLEWTIKAADAIQQVGGSVTILNRVPKEFLTTMIRNGLQIVVVNK